MVKLYVGCALTQAPAEFQERVRFLKEKLKTISSVEVMEFLGTVAGTARDVYIHDIIECVGRCDLMIAICDFPSIGLGWEMATQVARRKPLMAFAHSDSKVTRLILDPGLPNYYFYRYDDFDEIRYVIEGMVKEIQSG